MQRRPEVDVSVGKAISNFYNYTNRLPFRSSMTTKLPIHTSGVGSMTFKFQVLAFKNDSSIPFRMPEMLQSV